MMHPTTLLQPSLQATMIKDNHQDALRNTEDGDDIEYQENEAYEEEALNDNQPQLTADDADYVEQEEEAEDEAEDQQQKLREAIEIRERLNDFYRNKQLGL
jgi:hypothetical protein